MNLESPIVTVSKSSAYLFDALSDIKNFEKLMPENIAKFEVIESSYLLTTQCDVSKFMFIENSPK